MTDIPNRSFPYRWVDMRFGQANYAGDNGQFGPPPGVADANVLAVSWQPAFCETYGYRAGKPECLELSSTSYQAKHLVLHGLWPNASDYGFNYSYCGARKQAHHCSYEPVQLSEPVATKLRQFMPSFAYGSCLERHEWNRHGSCQLLSQDDYFSLALRLNEEVNESTYMRFIQAHIGESVSLADIHKAFDAAFGDGSANKVYFGCSRGALVDMFINLPALLPYDQNLKTLVGDAAESNRSDGCPSMVRISNFYTQGSNQYAGVI
jgi:ribonuclease T2